MLSSGLDSAVVTIVSVETTGIGLVLVASVVSSGIDSNAVVVCAGTETGTASLRADEEVLTLTRGQAEVCVLSFDVKHGDSGSYIGTSPQIEKGDGDLSDAPSSLYVDLVSDKASDAPVGSAGDVGGSAVTVVLSLGDDCKDASSVVFTNLKGFAGCERTVMMNFGSMPSMLDIFSQSPWL